MATLGNRKGYWLSAAAAGLGRGCAGDAAGREHRHPRGCGRGQRRTYRRHWPPRCSGVRHAGRNRLAEHDASLCTDRGATRRDERSLCRRRHSRNPSRRCGPGSAPSLTRSRPGTSAHRPISIRACVSLRGSITTRRSAPSAGAETRSRLRHVLLGRGAGARSQHQSSDGGGAIAPAYAAAQKAKALAGKASPREQALIGALAVRYGSDRRPPARARCSLRGRDGEGRGAVFRGP